MLLLKNPIKKIKKNRAPGVKPAGQAQRKECIAAHVKPDFISISRVS